MSDNEVAANIANTLFNWMSNDEATNQRLERVAAEAVRDDMGTGVGRDDFERMLRTGDERWDYARVVGIAVAGEVAAILDEDAGDFQDSLTYKILTDLLDLDSSAVKDRLGECFMPGVDDVEWLDEDSDDDEEGDL